METLKEKIDSILNQFIWEEMTLKKAKVIRKQLAWLKREKVNEFRAIRNWLKELVYPEIMKIKEYIKNNTKKRKPREPMPENVMQEIEAPVIEQPTEQVIEPTVE